MASDAWIEKFIFALQALILWPSSRLSTSIRHRALQTFVRRQTALVRLVERGPDGLARVKGTPFGRLA